MPDIEKVIQGIKACWTERWYHRCFDCPYKPDRDNDDACMERLGADALELLKEHKEHEELLTKVGYHWTGNGKTLALCKKSKAGEQE